MKTLFKYNEKKLSYEKVGPKTYYAGAGMLVATFGLGWMLSTNTTIDRIIHRVTDTVEISATHFSENALIRLLKENNIKYPHIVLAQAKLESNNFTSKIFKQNNNMFGMRRAHQRITTAQDERNTYALYRDWIDGVHDMGMYQSTVMCSVSSEEGYFNKLGERYAEDSLYVTKLKSIIKNEKLKNLFED